MLIVKHKRRQETPISFPVDVLGAKSSAGGLHNMADIAMEGLAGQRGRQGSRQAETVSTNHPPHATDPWSGTDTIRFAETNDSLELHLGPTSHLVLRVKAMVPDRAWRAPVANS